MFMMVCIMMFSKTIGNFFALLSMQWGFFCIFLSRIQKYRIFISCERCCLIVLLEMPEYVLLSVNNCVMSCGWPYYSKLFRKMMTYISVTKHPLVSASVEEVQTE